MTREYRYPEDYPFEYMDGSGRRARFMEADDIMGAIILCPHCDQKLKVIEVTPIALWGRNPDDGRDDRWFAIKLEDDTWVRFWTDNKVILGPPGTEAPPDSTTLGSAKAGG